MNTGKPDMACVYTGDTATQSMGLSQHCRFADMAYGCAEAETDL